MSNFFGTSLVKFAGKLVSCDFSNASNFDVTGGNNFVFAGGKVTLASTGNYAYTNFISLKNSTNSFRTFRNQFKFTIKDIISENGFALGFASSNTTVASSQLLEFSFSGGIITAFVKSLGYSTAKNELTGYKVSCQLNDLIRVDWTQTNFDSTVRIINTRTKDTALYTFNNASHNTSKLAIFNLGSAVEISYFDEYCETNLYTEKLFIGDSLSEGTGIYPNYNNSWTQVVAGKDNHVICAGGGDKSLEAVAAIGRSALFYPKKVIIELGTNDGFQGVSNGAYIANLTTIYNAFTAKGAAVYFLNCPPCSNGTTVSRNSALSAAFPGRVIDIYSILTNGSNVLRSDCDSGDGTHWNILGNQLVGNEVNEFLQ